MLADNIISDDSVLLYRNKDFTMRIESWGRGSFRVRITPRGGGQTSDWALDIPQEKAQSRIEISEHGASIQNGKILMSLRDTSFQKALFSVYKVEDGKRAFLFGEYDYMTYANNPGTHAFKPGDFGLFSCELHLGANDGERFYGMGQNETGCVDLKGCVIDLYQRHTKAPVPFVVSSRGYGML